jgi:hypothetical protein
LRCMKKYGHSPSGKFDRIWILFASGTGCWLVAQLFWSVSYFL